ncbi:MAG: beta-galactosidase [Bacillota bacterium]|jgi:beta-galactosidase|nr:beta-galactosidase [Bacillota bacterium]
MNGIMTGVNYHPHDWEESRWPIDIDLMKKANIKVVRLGHLCWDSFQPEENRYTFDWFDRVIELFNEAKIKVILDIPTRPAPLWLHRKFPAIDICDRNGIRQNPVFRYMEDVGDPNFQKYALEFASALVKRYGHHPALLGFGLCNEIGSGYISYSASAQARFIQWLKKKYETVERLNRAWARQRWSRRLSSFEDVTLPVSGLAIGAPECILDMRRFYSDELGEYMVRLNQVVKSFDNTIPTSSNHWSENPEVGFDYLKYYRKFVDYPGIGFYPGGNPEDRKSVSSACLNIDHRIGEHDNPMWALEFQTGTFGGFACPDKVMRMYAYLSLIHRNQIVCGWTWRSMYGGEEQYLFGLLDHSGVPSKKYYEFKQIGDEFKMLNKMGLFPRKTKPQIAIAYSFESRVVTDYAKSYYRSGFLTQIQEVYYSLYVRNLDCNIVDLRNMTKEYKLLIIPGIALIDPQSEHTIREFVKNGGTVVMTAYSAKVDENNQVYTTPLPGRVNDIFGIRVTGFDQGKTSDDGGISNELYKGKKVVISHDGATISEAVDYYEILELLTAQKVCDLTGTNEPMPALTVNQYGKGKAYYVAVPAEQTFFGYILDILCEELSIEKPPAVPDGIAVRKISEDVYLYVNTIGNEIKIPIASPAKSLFGNGCYKGVIPLSGYEVEIVHTMD